MKRAIVDGATGAIGSALVKELTDKGIEVLVLVRPKSSRKDNIMYKPAVSVLECGMDGYSTLENLTEKKYDVFYHLAWAGTAGPGRNDMYLQTKNIRYALDAVGVARRFGCKKFIGAGSQAEYGRVEGKLKPDTPTFPEMGYGYAKLCAGQMTKDYAHQLGMEHIWTRILSIYGPNDGKQSMIMSTIDKLLKGEVPKFTKGEQLWDYLYSDDAAKALHLLGEKGKDGKVYVLGSGQVHPLAEYICTIRDIVDPGAKIKIGAVPYSDRQVMHLEADIGAIKRDTGWSPLVEFKEGIIKIVQSIENKK